MKASNLDLFDPQTAIMDSSDYTLEVGRGDGDFGFAFNDSNFSDRILRIEIVSESTEARSDGEGCASLADWAKNRKRRREDIKRENESWLTLTLFWWKSCFLLNECLPQAVDMTAEGPEEQILNQPDNIPDDLDAENQDEENAAMIEEAPSGDEGANDLDSNWSMECSTIVKVKTLHISSPILAAKSPFFYKLFSNGMRESEQRHVTLRINASEEAALMELLNFMYSNTLTVTTALELLDVLMAADKFEVASCMRYCSRSLRNLDMTPESALLYLDLPSSVLMAEAVQPLTDAAKQFLAVRYKDITKFLDEVLTLPLAGVEAILASDDLQVASEDAVYDFVLKWSRLQYPKIEERREILATRLAQFIRFPYMTCRKLRKVMACNDFDHDFAQKVVVEALFFKAEAPHRQRTLAADENPNPNRRFIERAYKYRPVKVVEFEQPRQQCVVYLDLKREECANLFPAGRVYSQAFHLGGQGFFLSAHCNMDQQSSFHCFGLFLGMQEKGSVTFAVDYEFAARSKPTEEYISKYKGNYTFTGGKAVGYRNLFAIPWTSFMAEDSLYFINGILHLRAELTIRH
ncbi:BTB/POZ domain-containing protein POB1 isoform X1 [Helianthus annuus]|uniref:BTB/POZ domain-containing protein POB1 isoform X1 n=1 Tax=Helianthus annuus TaxID=4232 RepID=UPI000B8F5BFC|nr:BTB/POZ domain-containing protein POB1 isoform X1 [Helianthus annuus]